jgi:hypothetical protein
MVCLARRHIETMIWINKLGIFNAVAERLNTASQHDGMDASMIAR